MLKNKNVKTCVVKGCTNTNAQGEFIGDLCKPCYEYLVSGKIGPTNSFLGNLFEICNELGDALDQELNFSGNINEFDCERGFNALNKWKNMRKEN